MEYIDTLEEEKEHHHKMTNSERNQLIFLGLIAVAIILLLATFVFLVKNVDKITENPIDYAIENSDINSCTCFLPDGSWIDYPSESKGVIQDGSAGDFKLYR